MAQVLRHLPPPTDPRFLARIGDDAAVYRLSEDLAMVQTVDFITPVLNDPYTFGQVAAANAFSDIYAMGATPVFALNLVGFPVRSLPLRHLEDILRGGAAKAAEAGVTIAGGHSIEDHVPKYGLSVTGFVHPERLVTKSGGKPGDLLYLTKPLGSGLIITALDRGEPSANWEDALIPLLTATNREASGCLPLGATACTDVSGFGLLGHLHEMAQASKLAAQIQTTAVPILPGIDGLAARRMTSEGNRRNLRFTNGFTNWGKEVSPESKIILSDPQTSGGLLIAVPPEKAASLVAALAAVECCCAPIGHLLPGEPGNIYIS